MRTVCKKDECTGCMACVDICVSDAIEIVDDLDTYNAVIQENCINCGACQKICPTLNAVTLNKPIEWVQGWTMNAESRKQSSSGGLATAIAKNFIDDGGIVYGCSLENGNFGFKSAKNDLELEQFRGSKYVKSNPKGLYKDIRKKLKAGNKVLLIGLPCQVAGCSNFIRGNLKENLYTIDLICHGTPSPTMLSKFLAQYKINISNIENIRFRQKGRFRVDDREHLITAEGVRDFYTIAFLKGLFYTKNCYRCNYAKLERCSDLTLGDSWGSELTEEEKKKGISLVLCQTKKGKQLLKGKDLHLEAVELKRAIESNHQLQAPMVQPLQREQFMKGIKKGKKFNNQVRKAFPKICIKQDVKRIIYKIKNTKVGG